MAWNDLPSYRARCAVYSDGCDVCGCPQGGQGVTVGGSIRRLAYQTAEHPLHQVSRCTALAYWS